MKARCHGMLRSAVVSTMLAISAVGCGPSAPFSFVPVSGRVVYEDGTPLGTGQLVFSPQTPPVGDAHPHAGVASIGPDGYFDKATTMKPGDGLIRGKHKVAIQYATDAEGNALIPNEYTMIVTSPLVIDTADSPLTIKVPKP